LRAVSSRGPVQGNPLPELACKLAGGAPELACNFRTWSVVVSFLEGAAQQGQSLLGWVIF
jgi:hypothetical protein